MSPEIPGSLAIKFEPRLDRVRPFLSNFDGQPPQRVIRVYGSPAVSASNLDSSHERLCVKKNCGAGALELENGRTVCSGRTLACHYAFDGLRT